MSGSLGAGRCIAIATCFLFVALLVTVVIISRKPADSACVRDAASWTTRIAIGDARLADARRSLDPRTFDVVRRSLFTQIEENTLRGGASRTNTPGTLREIRVLCAT